MTNRFGLSRHIPAETALEVRRRSKFGCVMCRSAIYTYEHIEPEFVDAQSHDPDHICLLCGGCHDRVTRGRISKATVREQYRLVQSSDSIRRPFEELDLASSQLTIIVGGCTFESPRCLFRINGQELLSITPSQDGASFPSISGVFYDDTGKESLRISNNVWEGPNDAWDMSVVGRDVCIKSKTGKPVLIFEISPPSVVRVKKLNMYWGESRLVCNSEITLIGQIHNQASPFIGLMNFTGRGVDVAFSVNTSAFAETVPVIKGMRMIGGKGIYLDGTGIIVAEGAGVMHVGQVIHYPNLDDKSIQSLL